MKFTAGITAHLTVVPAAALVTACLAAPAHAEGFTAGASLGTPRYEDSVNGVTGKGSGLSGKLYGGYEFNPWFSLEAGLADLGHARSDGLKVDGRAVFLDAVGTAALTDRWSLLGRVGVARATLDTTAGDDHGSGLKLGLGAQYKLSSNVAVRGEWERYRPSVFGDKPNVDQWTLGVKYSF